MRPDGMKVDPVIQGLVPVAASQVGHSYHRIAPSKDRHPQLHLPAGRLRQK